MAELYTPVQSKSEEESQLYFFKGRLIAASGQRAGFPSLYLSPVFAAGAVVSCPNAAGPASPFT
jgi:hypothetical protein